jgi:hypothetical protein
MAAPTTADPTVDHTTAAPLLPSNTSSETVATSTITTTDNSDDSGNVDEKKSSGDANLMSTEAARGFWDKHFSESQDIGSSLTPDNEIQTTDWLVCSRDLFPHPLLHMTYTYDIYRLHFVSSWITVSSKLLNLIIEYSLLVVDGMRSNVD